MKSLTFLWVEQRTNAVVNIQRYDLNVKSIANQKDSRPLLFSTVYILFLDYLE